MKKLLPLAFALFALPALAAGEKDKPAAPPDPPEVKKTVDAFAGNWVIEGTVTGMPGMAEPLKIKEPMSCKAVARGLVAQCAGKANTPMGPVEDVAFITYDRNAKVVRFIGLSSMGDVHDHHCAWKDDKTLACEPLQLSFMGQPASVDLSVTFSDAKTAKMNETTTLKDGTKVAFDGVCKKK